MKTFVVQWNSGRRFPTGPSAADEFWNNRYYIGNVKMAADGRVVTYKGYLPTNSDAFELSVEADFSADRTTLEPRLRRKKPRFTWRVLPNKHMDTRAKRFLLDEVLCRHFPQCIAAINALDAEALQRVHDTMRREPWLLCMWCVVKKRFPALDTLAPAACLEYVRAHEDVNAEQVVVDALGVLGHVRSRQSQNGDTLFSGQFPGAGVQWLIDRGEMQLVQPYGLCLTRDFKTTTLLLQSVRDIIVRHTERVAVVRNGEVPCTPAFSLTEEQRAFATHVARYPVTMLNAPPGCGKTEMIVWINSHFRNVLNVTYVGAMVEKMQQRLGNHQGIAHTIHHVTTTARMGGEPAHEWLAQYDVVVVDEASNVDEHLLCSLLRAVPAACKLVLIGDLHQIYPIDAGCPFHNLVHSAFGTACTFHLTRNLRVDPAFTLLARANERIRNDEAAHIEFGLPGSALVRFDRTGDVKAIVKRAMISGGYKALLDFQFVTMRNDDRVALNEAVEHVCLELGLLTYAHKRDAKKSLFIGKKIMFLKTCKPVVKKAKQYAGVRNGEIVLIKSLVSLPGGDLHLVTHNNKVVLLSKNTPGAPTPSDVDAAYCVTCNKSQGSEWAHVVVWMPANRFPFTREYPYVGFSRARQSCTLVGSHAELVDMCRFRATPRKTLLARILADTPLEQAPADVPELDFDSEKEVAPANTPNLFPLLVYPETVEKKRRKKKR